MAFILSEAIILLFFYSKDDKAMEQTKKRSAVEWAMHYRHIVILITSCLIAFGVYGLAEMNKNEFPDFTIRQGVVVAVYPGATAEDVEQQVTKPLEDYIFTYKEVKKAKTKSYSRNGMSIIQVELNDDLNNKDEFWSKFKHGINAFKAQLPSGVLAIQVNDDFGDTSALLITMESDDKTYREMHDYMTALKDSLRKIESVGRMRVSGEQKEQISVYLDADRLSKYGISEQTIAMQLLGKGFETSAGTIKEDGHDMPIYVSRSLNAVNDVEQTIVYASPDGNVVRLKDVAKVKREFPKPTSFVTNNGHKCLVLSVEMKQGKNITEMGSDIDKKLDAFKKTMPKDVSLFKITDQPQVVGASVWNFLRELLIAIVAVVIVVLLLMPVRVALVASSTIPISIFISLGLFYAFGIELNTVTLAALIVTLGMIVDNSIVIIDSYVELIGEGVPRWQASMQSAEHFFKSILSATLAISVTFFPFLITMHGTMKDFLTLFPWAISIILFVSLFVAELVVPFLQFYFIRKPMGSGQENKDGKKKKSFLEILQSSYNWIIDRCFRHPYITISAGVVSVIIGVLMLGKLPQRLMPFADRNQFAVEIYLPSGTSLERTTALADSLEHIIKKDDRVVSVASFKGMASPRFQAGYAPQFAGPNYAQFIVNTKSNDATVAVLEKYRPMYENAFSGAYVRFRQLRYGTSANDVEVRLYGDDWEQLRKTADSITTVLRHDNDLRLVRNDVNEPLPAAQITLDPIMSSRLGINNLGVEATMAMRYNADGLPVGAVWEGDYKVNVSLKGTRADSATVTNLANEEMPTYGGLTSVPLRQVAKVKPMWYNGQISHRNGMRCITVMADAAQGVNPMAANSKVMTQLKDAKIPSGVSLSYGGEVEDSAENMPTLVNALIIAIVIIFFILLAHFRRISTATLLLVSLSLTLFGAAMGVFITGVDFSLTCFLGIISLMGILVRNAIIMYDYAEELRGQEATNELIAEHGFTKESLINGKYLTIDGHHLTSKAAIYLSARRRMRPIFLTSAAASMGVIPMILGRSGLWMPMGAVICFGTLITMFFILTILPIGYWLIMSGSSQRRQSEDEFEQQ